MSKTSWIYKEFLESCPFVMTFFISKFFWRIIIAGGVVTLLGGIIWPLGIMSEGKLASNLAKMNVPLLETKAWMTQGALFLRSGTEDKGTLLLKHSEHEMGYRYNPKLQNLEPISDELWQLADGSTSECEAQFPPSPRVLRIDPKSDQLLAGDRKVATAGAVVLATLASPNSSMVAVLSATGPRGRSILPFLGRGGASGQHYHQIFSLPEVMPRGKPIPLPLNSERGIIIICWSPNERYVVYADFFFFDLSIVSINP